MKPRRGDGNQGRDGFRRPSGALFSSDALPGVALRLRLASPLATIRRRSAAEAKKQKTRTALGSGLLAFTVWSSFHCPLPTAHGSLHQVLEPLAEVGGGHLHDCCESFEAGRVV